MAEARGRFEWAQTSQILALIYAANRGKDAPRRDASDFNPYESRRAKEPEISLDPKESMDVLRSVFGKR